MVAVPLACNMPNFRPNLAANRPSSRAEIPGELPLWNPKSSTSSTYRRALGETRGIMVIFGIANSSYRLAWNGVARALIRIDRHPIRVSATGEPEGPDVFAVEGPVVRRLRSGQIGERRQHVHRGGHLLADPASGNRAGPPENGRPPKRSFGGRVAAAVQRLVRAEAGVVGLPAGGRPVVGGPKDQGVLLEAQLPELVEDLARRPVELFHRVAPRPVGALAAKSLAGERGLGAAGHGLREIEEKGSVPVRLDIIQRTFRVSLGQQVAVDGRFDHPLVFHQRQWRPNARRTLVGRHVGAVGDAEVRI